MQIFNFVVLSGIAAPRNVLTSHISKTHLPVVFPHLRELELNWCSKDQPRKKEGSLVRARVCVCVHVCEVCVFRMRLNLNKISASDVWAEINLNEFKWAEMSSKGLEWA